MASKAHGPDAAFHPISATEPGRCGAPTPTPRPSRRPFERAPPTASHPGLESGDGRLGRMGPRTRYRKETERTTWP